MDEEFVMSSSCLTTRICAVRLVTHFRVETKCQSLQCWHWSDGSPEVSYESLCTPALNAACVRETIPNVIFQKQNIAAWHKNVITN